MLVMGRKLNDITNIVFKSLKAIRIVGKNSKRESLWECQCDCGNICYATSSDLNRGRYQFCKICNTKKSKQSPLLAHYSLYRRGADRRNHQFNLTIDEFVSIMKLNCYYCGTEPKQIFKKKGLIHDSIYNGIDRKNNKIGYTIDNCVPCCKFCNLVKNRFTINEFNDWIDRIIKFRSNESLLK